MTTDVAGSIREATNVGRNALLSAAQVDELAKGGLYGASGDGTVKGEREARDDFLRLILSLRSVTNYTDPISIAFVPRRILLCEREILPDALAPKILTLRVFSAR